MDLDIPAFNIWTRLSLLALYQVVWCGSPIWCHLPAVVPS